MQSDLNYYLLNNNHWNSRFWAIFRVLQNLLHRHHFYLLFIFQGQNSFHLLTSPSRHQTSSHLLSPSLRMQQSIQTDLEVMIERKCQAGTYKALRAQQASVQQLEFHLDSLESPSLWWFSTFATGSVSCEEKSTSQMNFCMIQVSNQPRIRTRTTHTIMSMNPANMMNTNMLQLVGVTQTSMVHMFHLMINLHR